MVIAIGHRGAPFHEPENTLLSFRKAIELGAEMIELDVHMSSDGEIVVIHDETVDRTTDGKGLVGEMTISDLRSLDAGKGERIPILSEVLDVVDGVVPVNIELKGPNTAGPVHDELSSRIGAGALAEEYLVSSFDPVLLNDFTVLGGGIPSGVLMNGKPELAIDFARDIGAVSVNPSARFTTERFVRFAHARGLEVYVWTVDDPDEMLRLALMGVDGIFSNAPERVLAVRSAMEIGGECIQ
jgi:glycerophosphoryl diester phosphodiesterase